MNDRVSSGAKARTGSKPAGAASRPDAGSRAPDRLESLREQEWFRHLIENLQEGYALCRIIREGGRATDFVYLETNRAFEEITGLKGVVGRRVSEVIPGIHASNPELLEIYGRVALTGRPEKFETYLPTLDTWFRVSVYSPQKDDFVAVFENSTEQKRREREVAELAKFPAQNPSPILRLDPKGVIAYANDASRGILASWGRRSGELAPEPWPEVVSDCLKTGSTRVLESPLGERTYSLVVIPVTGADYASVYAHDVTDRVQAQEALSRSESKYRSLYDSMTDAYGMVDMSGRFIEFNHAFLQMLGYAAEEIRSLTFRDITPEKWHGAEARIIEERVLKHGTSDVYEKEFRRKDGTIFPVELRTYLVRDESGLPTAMWAIVRDISDRRQQEARLHQLNRLYRTLQEVNELIVRCQSPDALFEGVCQILTTTGGFSLAWVGLKQDDGSVRVAASAGPAIAYMDSLTVRWDDTPHGRGPTGRAIREESKIIFTDFTREPDFAPWKLLAAGSGLQSSGAFPLREGTRVIGAITIYVSEAGFIGEDEQNLLSELALDIDFALQSLTTQRQSLTAVEALREKEAGYRAMVENLNDIIYIGQPDGTLTFINPAAERILGYPPSESVGRKIFDFVHPDDRATVRERSGALLQGKAGPLEVRLLARDGSVRWFRSASRPIAVGDAVVGVQGVLTDITSRKSAEAQVEQNRQDLEKLVRERTADLTAARAAALNLMQDSEIQRREIEQALAESKRMQEALRASEDNVRRILQTTNEGFWRIDARTRTLEVNDSMCDILGRERKDIVGKSIYDFVDAENKRIFERELTGRAQGRSGSYEIVLSRSDGSGVFCLFNATPIADKAGGFAGSFAMVTDISRRKEAEEEVRRRAVELEAFNKAMVDREMKVIEMKEEVNNLLRELGRPPAYPPVWSQDHKDKTRE